MIGGIDVRIPVPSGPTALSYAVRFIWRQWPQCVFVADDDSAVLTRYEHLAFRDASEVIIYRDAAACSAWRELGYDESVAGTMFYLISDPTDLTVVIDTDPTPATLATVASIRRGIASAFPQLQEAA